MGIKQVRALTTTLPSATWAPLVRAHAERADQMTAGHRARRATGEKHAIEDFLYDYYGTRPAMLRRWHPGVGAGLAAAPDGLAAHAGWKFYATSEDGALELDPAKGQANRFILRPVERAGSPFNLALDLERRRPRDRRWSNRASDFLPRWRKHVRGRLRPQRSRRTCQKC